MNPELLQEIIDALKANQIFHTALVGARLGGFDEYQQDAITRTRQLLEKFAQQKKDEEDYGLPEGATLC